MRTFLPFLIFALSVPLVSNATGWQQPLALDGGDYWQARLPVTVTNAGGNVLEGFPVALTIDSDGATAPLIGREAREIRVTNEIGTEMLFVVYGEGGDAIDRRRADSCRCNNRTPRRV